MSTNKKTSLITIVGTAIVLGAVLAAPVRAAAAEEGSLSAVGNEGREVTVNGKNFKVSGSRTKIMIAGKQAKRDQLKSGMKCKVEGDDEASTITCK